MVVESHRTITHDGAANHHSSCKVAVFCSRDCAHGSAIAAGYLWRAFGRWRWSPWSIARLPLVCMAGTKLRIVTFMKGTVLFSTERAARPSTSQRLAVKNWSSHSTWGACAERHYTLFLCCLLGVAFSAARRRAVCLPVPFLSLLFVFLRRATVNWAAYFQRGGLGSAALRWSKVKGGSFCLVHRWGAAGSRSALVFTVIIHFARR